MIEIEKASYQKHSEAELSRLYDIVIKGYELTEEEVWGKNYIRIFKPDYFKLIAKNEIFVAKYNGVIAGGVHAYALRDNVYTFSLLGTDFELGGLGIGTALIKAVEEEALASGAKSIEMEVLRVRGVDTVPKVRLANYYKRLGYSFIRSEDCSCKIPDWKYKKLIQPSDFDFYRKLLNMKSIL